jgi:hypothetical protein
MEKHGMSFHEGTNYILFAAPKLGAVVGKQWVMRRM